MKRIMTFYILLAVIAGCSSGKSKEDLETVDMKYALDSSSTIAPEHLSFKFGADLIRQRIDLFRPKKRETEYFRKRKIQYHYIGLYLGNGLFIDANNNFVIDILNYFGIDVFKTNLRVQHVDNPDSVYTSIRRNGDLVVEKYTQNEEPSLTMKRVNDTIFYSMDNWVESSDKIYFHKESIEYDSYMNNEIVKLSETHYQVPEFIGSKDFEMIGKDTIDLEYILVIRTDTEIQICDDNPDILDDGSYEVDRHFICKKDGFVLYDQNRQGFSAKREADTIFLSYNNNVFEKFIIEKTD